MLRVVAPLIAVSLLLAAPVSAQTTSGSTAPAKAAPVVNINTASSAELQTLPGVGERVAARIIEYREKNGPFKKIEELMNVQGIGEKVFLRLRTQLTVSARPADQAGQR
jgi:competence protein ComEA